MHFETYFALSVCYRISVAGSLLAAACWLATNSAAVSINEHVTFHNYHVTFSNRSAPPPVHPERVATQPQQADQDEAREDSGI